MDEMILRVKNLSKTYPKFELKKVSFDLPRGYIMGFVGPNGSGKTTTVKTIMNLVFPDSGSIEVFGLDHRAHEQEVKRRIGYVSEDQNLYEEMSAGWTARFVSRYYPDWDDRLYRQLLQKFQLDESKKINEFSKGMKVKFALTLALAHRPELLILDEPTSGLDPVVRHDLLRELMDVIQDEARSVFFSSHITDDLEKVADYVTFINDGRILLSEVKDDLLANWKRVKLRTEKVDDRLRSHFVALHGVGNQVVGITSNFARLRESHPAVFAGGVQVDNLGLDDILLSLVKGEVQVARVGA